MYGAKYIVLVLIAVTFILFGLSVQPIASVLRGIVAIVVEPAILITDYMAVGGIGAAFVNSGLLMLVSLVMLLLLKVEIGGVSVAAVFLMGSFALFGKNIANVWPIIFGVWLYSRLKREPFKNHVHVALLATSIAPMVTELLFITEMALWARIVLSLAAGIGAGLLIVPLSVNVLKLHEGYNLYNIGFSVGILGTVFVSVFKSYGYTTYTRMVWSTGNNQLLAMFLLLLFLSMMVIAVLMSRRVFVNWWKIIRLPGRLSSDFIAAEGFAPVLLNMGINGLFALTYILLVGGSLNGPTIGGILTVAGFGAFGKHFRNITPIFIGVVLGGITKTWNINDPAILIAALFGTSLAPIAGQFGWKWGVAAGFINSSVVLNSGILHGGMNLYNTGFSAGIVAALMVPILNILGRPKLLLKPDDL